MQGMDWPLLAVSGGFLLCFLAAALVDIDAVSALVGALFAWSTKVFGLYWQILMLATFVSAWASASAAAAACAWAAWTDGPTSAPSTGSP